MTEWKIGLTKFYCTNHSERFRTSPYAGEGGKSILKIKAEEVPQMLPLHQASLQLTGGAVAPQTLPAPAPRSKPCTLLGQAETQQGKLSPVTIPDGHPPSS